VFEVIHTISEYPKVKIRLNRGEWSVGWIGSK